MNKCKFRKIVKQLYHAYFKLFMLHYVCFMKLKVFYYTKNKNELIH